MPRTVVPDELLVTVRVPAGLPARTARAIRSVVLGARTKRRLRDAMRAELRAFRRTGVRITIAP